LRVICWKELVKTWHGNGITIVGVPFAVKKGIWTKATEI